MRRSDALASLFPTILARLLGILALTALPVLVLTASIALQNRHISLALAHQRSSALVAAAISRAAAESAQVEQTLRAIAAALASAPAISDASCASTLWAARTFAEPRLLAISLLGSAGELRCRAAVSGRAGVSDLLPTASLGVLFDSAQGQSGLVTAPSASIGPPMPSGAVAMAVALGPPGQTAAAPAAVLVAELSADWLAGSAGLRSVPNGTAWVAAGSRLIPVRAGADTEGAEPSGKALATILAHDGDDVVAPSRSGQPYVYGAQTMAGGLRVVVGVPATSDVLRADSLFGRRLLELVALLLLGLLVIATGAHAVVVRPIRQLARAVLVWRNGGAFDPRPPDGAPREVVELARVFGEATTALRVRELELRDASAQQDLLMQEIHHRVKNNLQIVASLLNLQASRIRQPEARAEFQAARDRIRALATLHRHLYAHGELHTINMRAFLNELCGQLLQAIGETPAGGRIVLDIQAPELQITSDRAVPLALIVTEAVSNAAKYAFPGGRSGHITVRVEPIQGGGRAEPEAIRLLIQDNGVGIPAGQAETEAGVRDGIGIQLIRGFARQLGATLDVVHDGGTRYVLEVPLHRERHEPESLERVTEVA